MSVYLVTTDKNLLPGNPIVMLDGTVPGWEPKQGDLHFDHHKPGGKPIQIAEIMDSVKLPENPVFVTTQVDADACVAAAWIQLLQMPIDQCEQYEIYRNLAAIAYDCDHLGLPDSIEWDPWRKFAAKAVAALKETGNALAEEMGLPSDRKVWSEAQKVMYASESFKRGTEWLIEASLGDRPWPGERGEADAYFERMEAQRPKVYENCYLYRGCAIFDQRAFDGYVDPRLLVEWAREQGSSNITLTIRDGSRLPNALSGWEEDQFSYTLGSVPLHSDGSPQYSDRGMWAMLAALEAIVREQRGLAPASTTWGGRNEVGGSGWRDPAIAPPTDVIDTVLRALG